MLHIDFAESLGNKNIKLKFKEYPQEYIVNMTEYIKFNSDFYLIKELSSDEKFKDFTVDHGAILWKNGFDIAPEYLFFLANKNSGHYRTLFKEWGYIK